jgi:hypothetical protein
MHKKTLNELVQENSSHWIHENANLYCRNGFEPPRLAIVDHVARCRLSFPSCFT